MTKLRHPALGAALVAVVLSVAFAVTGRSRSGSGSVELVERWSVDWRFRARGPQPVAPELALVTFDDETARKAGPLFERRLGWAKVIEAVNAQGARVIGVDAVFDVPERLLDGAVRDRVLAWQQAHPVGTDDGPTEQLLRDISTELLGDARLASTLKTAGNVVLILFAGDGDAQPLDSSLSRARYAQSTPGANALPHAEALVASLPEFTRAAKASGFASVTEDETRTVRRLGLAVEHQGGTYMPFTVAMTALIQGVGRGAMAYLGPQQEVRLGERSLTLDDDAQWLNYRGPSGSYPTFSALDVAEGKVPAEALRGKAVLIGVTRLGYDVARTPFGSMSGVEVQANAIDGALRGDALHRTKHVSDALLTLAAGLVMALLFASRRTRLLVQLLVAAVVVAAYLGGSYVAFAKQGLWLPWVAPTAVAVASLLTGLALAYASEALQRRALRQAFGAYLGADVLDQLLAHPEKLKLGGEKRNLTVLFTDICDFTTLSERLSPEQLVTFLNTYLTPMTRAVLAQGGLLDKYIGDAVMGVFGAPVPRENHVRDALACVVQMHRDLDALNEGALKALNLNIAIGAGVNTGDMVVGNMGSNERFDYTVAGDAVNLASRLEGLTRKYGVFCIVGEATRRAAGEGFSFRALDLVQVKGKHDAVEIFELVAAEGRTLAPWTALPLWDAALTAFRAGQLSEARAAFTAFAAQNPSDVVVARYLERLAALPERAPADFSPVTVFGSK